jgi:hypothetical protein
MNVKKFSLKFFLCLLGLSLFCLFVVAVDWCCHALSKIWEPLPWVSWAVLFCLCIAWAITVLQGDNKKEKEKSSH